mgnify:CR=1 FL=1
MDKKKHLLLLLFSLTGILGFIYIHFIVGLDSYFYLILIAPTVAVIYIYKNDSLSRREYFILATIFTLLVIGPIYISIHSSYYCESQSSFNLDRTSGNDIRVVWCEDSVRQSIGANSDTIAFTLMFEKNVELGPIKLRDKIYLIEENQVNHRLMLHETGHAIGLNHKEKGIMASEADEIRNEKYPGDEALLIASKVENYKIINWSSKKDYEFLREEYENGNLSRNGIQWAYYKHTNYNKKDIYYKSDFDDFGGVISEDINDYSNKFYSLD